LGTTHYYLSGNEKKHSKIYARGDMHERCKHVAVDDWDIRRHVFGNISDICGVLEHFWQEASLIVKAGDSAGSTFGYAAG
jgi:hypothetical protein